MSDSESDTEEQESLEDAYNRAKVSTNTAEERWTPVSRGKMFSNTTGQRRSPQYNRQRWAPTQ